MLKLVDKLFLGNSSVKLCGFKSHCLHTSESKINMVCTVTRMGQWDIVEFFQFNKSHCLQEYIYIYIIIYLKKFKPVGHS